jgi:hypothetical protein
MNPLSGIHFTLSPDILLSGTVSGGKSESFEFSFSLSERYPISEIGKISYFPRFESVLFLIFQNGGNKP